VSIKCLIFPCRELANWKAFAIHSVSIPTKRVEMNMLMWTRLITTKKTAHKFGLVLILDCPFVGKILPIVRNSLKSQLGHQRNFVTFLVFRLSKTKIVAYECILQFPWTAHEEKTSTMNTGEGKISRNLTGEK